MVGLRAWATRRRSSVLLVLDALGAVSWVALGLLLALVWGSFVGFVTQSEEEDRPGGAAMGTAPPSDQFSYERAGTFSVALTMTSYLRDTDTVLVEKPPLIWSVDAVAPPADDDWLSWARDLWRQVTEAITGLGGLAVSVSAIAAVIAMVIRRRLPADGPDDDAGTTDPVPEVGRRPRPRPVRRVRRVRSRTGRAARRARARQSSGSSTGAISS
ncbi:hypothetical protein ACIRD9_38720 [Streptomyces violaceus]|uniref:hypothetical protein n=1 Tax=Streptomyces violaceus TaxID=1936 RepID=UPI00381A224A